MVQRCMEKRCLDENVFLLALPVFIDSSHTDVYGKNLIEPVQITLSIFNRKCRRKFNFWRPLGFINNLSTQKLYEQVGSETLDKATKLRDYHKILGVIFQSLKNVQEMGGFHFDLKYRQKTYHLLMKPILGPMIGDNQGQDKLVARYQSFGKTSKFCRYCDISVNNSDSTSCPFQYTKQSQIIKLLQITDVKQSTRAINEISYHYVPNNVFHTLDMGGDPRGIHGICPAEILHTLRLGIFQYSVRCLIDEYLYKTFKKKLDILATKTSKLCAHQSDRDVPRTMFKSGVCALTKITGSETSVVVLLIIMCMICIEGRQFF